MKEKRRWGKNIIGILNLKKKVEKKIKYYF
jgi:hypothetical protein